jgi:hypothetical protein
MAELPSFPRTRQIKTSRGTFVCYSSLRDLRRMGRLMILLEVTIIVLLAAAMR